MTKKTTCSPKFSIIIIDYDQSVDRGYMQRAIQCLMVQTFSEFEIILLHDGPKEKAYEDELNKKQLERLAYFANQELPPIYDRSGNIKNDNSILIFSIYMRGVVFCNGAYSRRVGEEDTYSTIMTGIPTRYGNIDCMQLVMKRECWLNENGWHDKSRNSDGEMYPEFVKKYGARYIPELLGEHW